MEVSNSDPATEGEMEDVNMVPTGPSSVDGGAMDEDVEQPANKKITRVVGEARDVREQSVDMMDEESSSGGLQGAYRTPQSGVSSGPSTTTPATSHAGSSSSTSTSKTLNESAHVPAATSGDTVREAPPQIDEQIAIITQMSQKPTFDGMRGFVVSNAWLEEAQARGSNALRSSKETRADGPLPPPDNRELVDPRFPNLRDERGEPFYPLKPGFEMARDIEVIPEEAWQQILRWHGSAEGSPDIIRFCHNTSDNQVTENLMFELYPPVLTVLKLPDTSAGISKETLQANAAAPVKVVSSRNQPFADFLARAKEAARIPADTHVRVWRIMTSLKESLGSQGMLTPAQSRSHSPAPGALEPIDPGNKLVLDMSAFLGLQEGSQRELIDIPTDTNTGNGQPGATLGFAGLANEGVIVLEERIMGPAGGDWMSDVAKTNAVKNGLQPKSLLTAQMNVNKGNSAGSGRSSPAPAGMTTRGRASGPAG